MRELMNNFNYYSTYKINKHEEKVSFRYHTGSHCTGKLQ